MRKPQTFGVDGCIANSTAVKPSRSRALTGLVPVSHLTPLSRILVASTVPTRRTRPANPARPWPRKGDSIDVVDSFSGLRIVKEHRCRPGRPRLELTTSAAEGRADPKCERGRKDSIPKVSHPSQGQIQKSATAWKARVLFENNPAPAGMGPKSTAGNPGPARSTESGASRRICP